MIFKLLSDFSWIWTEATKQPNLEEKLDVGGSGYPVSDLAFVLRISESSIVFVIWCFSTTSCYFRRFG